MGESPEYIRRTAWWEIARAVDGVYQTLRSNIMEAFQIMVFRMAGHPEEDVASRDV